MVESRMANSGADGVALDANLLAATSAPGLTGELASIPQSASITVDKDNVLQAAKIINDVLNNEGRDIQQNLQYLSVTAPAADIVSVQAARQWNARLVSDPDSFSNRVSEYLASLRTIANNLHAAAVQYGYSEDQIAAVFQQVSVPGSPGA